MANKFAFSALFAISMIGVNCSRLEVEQPVGPENPFSIKAPKSLRLENKTMLGSLDLDGYCRSKGLSGSTLTKPQLGDNAAFNNWRCHSSGSSLPIAMELACQWQYGLHAVQAHPLDRNDAFAWRCYAS